MDGEIIFRNDDVNPNTNFSNLIHIYSLLWANFPQAVVWSAVSLFSEFSKDGAVYKGAPFKDKPKDFFYNVTRIFDKGDLYAIEKFVKGHKVVSHGLIHTDHSSLDMDALEMSIVSSCKILGTNVFVAPFNRVNDRVEDVCDKNGIELAKPDEWKSLEHQPFDPAHKKWYFHSWRFGADKVNEVLSGCRVY